MPSEPAALAGQARCRDPVGGAELADRLGQVVPHRAVRQVEPRIGGLVGLPVRVDDKLRRLTRLLGLVLDQPFALIRGLAISLVA